MVLHIPQSPAGNKFVNQRHPLEKKSETSRRGWSWTVGENCYTAQWVKQKQEYRSTRPWWWVSQMASSVMNFAAAWYQILNHSVLSDKVSVWPSLVLSAESWNCQTPPLFLLLFLGYWNICLNWLQKPVFHYRNLPACNWTCPPGAGFCFCFHCPSGGGTKPSTMCVTLWTCLTTGH